MTWHAVEETTHGLAEMGLTLDPDAQISVRDSTSEVRWLVLPGRPPGTGGLTAEELVPLITRDAMVGVAKVATP
ncbi:nitrile hydratase subunit alpha [Streptomyces sp. NPDC001852]|uniref:nitrile hydratase subunit alpha n=1 Tax=Streptomyces sp. NPDC001852 TaxID=3364619 RepID=UPI00369B7FAF